jgi:hypothetical protein
MFVNGLLRILLKTVLHSLKSIQILRSMLMSRGLVSSVHMVRVSIRCRRKDRLNVNVGELPVTRAAALKHTLRSMHRMMQSSGTAEGLRGLIDTSILKSIKKIIEYRGLFGPSVMPIGIIILIFRTIC